VRGAVLDLFGTLVIDTAIRTSVTDETFNSAPATVTVGPGPVTRWRQPGR
jgi:hypothetical protein